MSNAENKSVDESQQIDVVEPVHLEGDTVEISKTAKEETMPTTPSMNIKPLEAFQSNQSDTSKKVDKKPTSLFIEVLDIIRSVIVCFVVAWVIATFIAKPIRIDGTSMYPTLHHNDYGLSNVIGLRLSPIKRFDVVVVFEPWLNDHVIKRIIGLPGETISYLDNQLFINGELVEEPFFDESYRTQMMGQTNAYFTQDFEPVVLGDSEYFIMGDNRPKSSDSREYGAIKKSQIVSKQALIFFPLKNIGIH